MQCMRCGAQYSAMSGGDCGVAAYAFAMRSPVLAVCTVLTHGCMVLQRDAPSSERQATRHDDPPPGTSSYLPMHTLRNLRYLPMHALHHVQYLPMRMLHTRPYFPTS
eukprot:600095-Rhodomonas_salina.1